MGSLTQQSELPVIEFSESTLNPGSSPWVSACVEVVRALEDYGCFVAVYDKVPSEVCRAIFRASEEAFGLPTETKVLNTSDAPSHGYVGGLPVVPLFEALGIENANTSQGVQKFTDLMWPTGNDQFSETAISYSKFLVELIQAMMRMISETYGVEKDCESLIGSMHYLLRLLKYRCPQENENNIGLVPHTDQSFLTVLHQRDINGLEIKTKDGNWLHIDSLSPTSFVVLAGDVCTAWTNGRIKAPHHRVIMHGNAERYAIGLFAMIRDLIVQVPQELVDDEHPLQYKLFDPYKYLFFCANEGKRSECKIKAYCGV